MCKVILFIPYSLFINMFQIDLGNIVNVQSNTVYAIQVVANLVKSQKYIKYIFFLSLCCSHVTFR